MTFQPAHKDTKNPPGQIVNPVESNVPRSKTIGGIIDRVMRSEAPVKPARTFEEWVNIDSVKTMITLTYEEDYKDILYLMEKAWKAARNEN